MRKLLLIALLTIQSLVTYSLVINDGPTPKTILAHAFTPTEVKQQMEQEKKQIKYDAAENVAARVLRRHGCNDEFAEVIGHAAVDEGLNPRVVAAVTIVESTCNPNARSHDAVGLMQVSPKTWHYTVKDLLNPAFNVTHATRILANYVHRFGLEEGLHHYNGLGVGCGACDDQYVGKVLRAAGYTT